MSNTLLCAMTVWCCAGDGSGYFVVGLTTLSPCLVRPTLWNYTVCGQYPGRVPAASTVSLQCPHNLAPFRYVIVQLPRTDLRMRVCELEVFARGSTELS